MVHWGIIITGVLVSFMIRSLDTSMAPFYIIPLCYVSFIWPCVNDNISFCPCSWYLFVNEPHIRKLSLDISMPLPFCKGFLSNTISFFSTINIFLGKQCTSFAKDDLFKQSTHHCLFRNICPSLRVPGALSCASGHDVQRRHLQQCGAAVVARSG